MAQTTGNLRDAEHAELSETDAADFEQRLAKFRDTLPDREKAILSHMVIEASDGQPPAQKGQAKQAEPTQDELDAFMEKLNRFHDELPADQHLYVDGMLVKTWFKDDVEVQGYYPWNTWITITNKERHIYEYNCLAAGGTWVERWRRGAGHRRFACVS
jgi:hypothetical protein